MPSDFSTSAKYFHHVYRACSQPAVGFETTVTIAIADEMFLTTGKASCHTLLPSGLVIDVASRLSISFLLSCNPSACMQVASPARASSAAKIRAALVVAHAVVCYSVSALRACLIMVHCTVALAAGVLHAQVKTAHQRKGDRMAAGKTTVMLLHIRCS